MRRGGLTEDGVDLPHESIPDLRGAFVDGDAVLTSSSMSTVIVVNIVRYIHLEIVRDVSSSRLIVECTSRTRTGLVIPLTAE